MTKLIPIEVIENKILVIRGQKVMIDRDLAQLYEVETKVLNQAVKLNIERFPDGFMFKLNDNELKELVTNCDRCHVKVLKEKSPSFNLSRSPRRLESKVRGLAASVNFLPLTRISTARKLA